jgi:hypothetical protein
MVGKMGDKAGGKKGYWRRSFDEEREGMEEEEAEERGSLQMKLT